MNPLEQIAARAAREKRKIVLPEGTDARVAAAAAQAAERGLAEVTVIAEGGKTEAGAAHVVDPMKNERADAHAEALMRARNKNQKNEMTREQALREIRAPLTLAMCMVACGDADGCVAGAAHTTADVVRAALQIVGAKAAGDSADGLVSSFFLMLHELPHQALRGTAVFADCAMVIDPDAAQLARIAMDTADSAAALLGMKPRVALLSFSTAGSARHAQVDKVRAAGEIVAARRGDIELLPEVQFDAAVVPEILDRKAPGMAGLAPANIFIFPDLQSANIGYKIAERLGAVTAVGPILQGLARPVNDLSRGCRAEDIVSLVAVTALQAQALSA
ncbi:MAG: phosphotransacetylase, partial [Gammaproteobacteria bacterium]|nr:phosphotransacetylase [Gammaproteobacteria bacterium]